MYWSYYVFSSCCTLIAAALLLLAGCAESGTPPADGSGAAPRATSPADQLATADPAQAPAARDSDAAAIYELATGTVYYSGDPLRGHKPGGTFRRGTKVSLVHRAGVYSVVRSEDGLEAYVATHTLAPLATQ